MSKGPIIVTLASPTVFADYNKQHQLSLDYPSTQITVQPMKHKHFRQMESLPDAKKMHYLMRELTGMSTGDLDELDIDDSAELTRVIMKYMTKYVELAREMGGIS